MTYSLIANLHIVGPRKLRAIWKFSSSMAYLDKWQNLSTKENTALSLMLFVQYKLWHLKSDGSTWMPQESTYLLTILSSTAQER